ncbi:sugar kinase [Ramlibacter tataouinensis]|uniref:Candidate 2-dehydro-3-deoxygluconokinase n=1 Tax=Ramlibacter tataouinensis (strain ATCC BAA-407 / DSM 14655 / LMG 21543 / TTB310) TaxID=365046 RepID=F5XVM3_RAMTT|nr:sugar kinase [Ramlibacter tataouinensis]AEG91599.1 Candidate 2-dehydro-3-deoxygluconokinase [Ramlibacter tataouinensis TTB310]
MSGDHRFDVALFGEMLLLLVADRPGPLESVPSFHKRTAGAETNVAIGLARAGLRVGWASRLGTDSMGRYLLGEMRREGIDCSRVSCDPAQRTGFQFKGRVTDGSDPPVEYHRKGSAASRMTPADIDVDWLLGARHLHATGVFPAISATALATARQALELMRAAGRTISFDPNLRPTLWATPEDMRREINALAFQADWVLPGLEEGRFLTGERSPEAIARFYRERGASLVAVKLGPEGAYYDGEQGSGHVPGFPVREVVDTVGAGDGFAVGVVSALLEGRGTADAVRRGAWIGARAVQVLGDTEGLPTRAELQAAGL